MQAAMLLTDCADDATLLLFDCADDATLLMSVVWVCLHQTTVAIVACVEDWSCSFNSLFHQPASCKDLGSLPLMALFFGCGLPDRKLF